MFLNPWQNASTLNASVRKLTSNFTYVYQSTIGNGVTDVLTSGAFTSTGDLIYGGYTRGYFAGPLTGGSSDAIFGILQFNGQMGTKKQFGTIYGDKVLDIESFDGQYFALAGQLQNSAVVRFVHANLTQIFQLRLYTDHESAYFSAIYATDRYFYLAGSARETMYSDFDGIFDRFHRGNFSYDNPFKLAIAASDLDIYVSDVFVDEEADILYASTTDVQYGNSYLGALRLVLSNQTILDSPTYQTLPKSQAVSIQLLRSKNVIITGSGLSSDAGPFYWVENATYSAAAPLNGPLRFTTTNTLLNTRTSSSTSTVTTSIKSSSTSSQSTRVTASASTASTTTSTIMKTIASSTSTSGDGLIAIFTTTKTLEPSATTSSITSSSKTTSSAPGTSGQASVLSTNSVGLQSKSVYSSSQTTTCTSHQSQSEQSSAPFETIITSTKLFASTASDLLQSQSRSPSSSLTSPASSTFIVFNITPSVQSGIIITSSQKLSVVPVDGSSSIALPSSAYITFNPNSLFGSSSSSSVDTRDNSGNINNNSLVNQSSPAANFFADTTRIVSLAAGFIILLTIAIAVGFRVVRKRRPNARAKLAVIEQSSYASPTVIAVMNATIPLQQTTMTQQSSSDV
ncbi:hypothetical protein MIR68_009807 [Amoeboaphelidium protococcarum]|nr:hypothetical protein MIR68_009807 [Amoeboaphelidium protococcarum]